MSATGDGYHNLVMATWAPGTDAGAMHFSSPGSMRYLNALLAVAAALCLLAVAASSLNR
jgi:hypothetical protein